MNEIEKTYEIPEQNFHTLLARIAVLNKRAAKLGCALVTVEKVDEVIETQYRWINDYSKTVYRRPAEVIGYGFEKTGNLRRIFFVRVQGEAPKFAGWTLAATIQTTEAGNILRCVPNAPALNPEYRTCTPACDHCKTDRNRKDTFVVIHDDGTQKQVGRQCIRDFLGHTSPETLARVAELLFSVSEICDSEGEWDGSGNSCKVFSTPVYLAHVAAVTDGLPFVTSKQSKEPPYAQPSSLTAAWNMNPSAEMLRKGQVILVEDKHRELAQKALAYVLEHITEPKNDFDHNLLVIAKSEALEARSFGIAAYLICYYRRETEARVARAAKVPSAFFGVVGTRYKKETLVYLGSNSFDTQYGVKHIHRFHHDTQYGVKHIHRFHHGTDLAVWKTTSEDLGNLNAGDTLTVDYTVGEHADYKGTAQTILKRCKILGVSPKPQTV